MNIAIVAPSPVPFVMGGAESVWLGLQRFINEATPHHCELFKIPTHENSLKDLVDAYARFCEVDAKSFDVLITGKYPAWMTEHHNHKIYMLHTLRGLYDTYHFTGEPLGCSWPEALLPVVRDMDLLEASGRAINSDILPCLQAIQRALDGGSIDAGAGHFPGPLSRDIVHRLDRLAMAPSRVTRYAAISKTVSKREGYFPCGADVAVAYPPSSMEGFHCRGDEFLFTASRLDSPKRVGLLIDAMKHVKSGIRLLIGGTGPEETRLREQAGGDKRIVFLGRLTEAELLDHYANALAIPFVPYDEDYGLITVEAMKSRKPVITVADSGGVTEFVVNGETGLCTSPIPEAVADAIDYMCAHRDEAREMGRKAERQVSDIRWESVAKTLLGEDNFYAPARKPATRGNKRRMVVATTFPIYPPRGGGQARIYHLYRAWSERYDISIVSLGAVGDALDQEIAPGLREIRVPKTVEHLRAEERFSAEVGWVPITDIVASRLIDKTPVFMDRLRDACRGADIVVASHPYFATQLRTCAPDAEFWFEVHNVEAKLKEEILPQTDAGCRLLEGVRRDEGKAWQAADVAFACAQNDLVEMTRLYGPNDALNIEVPNGFSPDEVGFVDWRERADVKRMLGLERHPTALFIGSWHGPNLEAIERIIGFADALPDVVFLIAGSGGLKFQNTPVPENVRLLGPLDEQEKQVALSCADLALNPMSSGSGSNLKMFDYFAAGIPVLTTPFGARGMDDEMGSCVLIAEPDAFPGKIFEFFVELGDEVKTALLRRARDRALDRYAWPRIAQRALGELDGNKRRARIP